MPIESSSAFQSCVVLTPYFESAFSLSLQLPDPTSFKVFLGTLTKTEAGEREWPPLPDHYGEPPLPEYCGDSDPEGSICSDGYPSDEDEVIKVTHSRTKLTKVVVAPGGHYPIPAAESPFYNVHESGK